MHILFKMQILQSLNLGKTFYLIFKTWICKKRSDYIYNEESNDEEEEENTSGIVQHEP